MCKDCSSPFFSPEVIAAIVAAVIAAYAAYLTWARNKWEKQKAQREIFDDFNKRFNSMNEALNAIWEWSKNGKALPESFQYSKLNHTGFSLTDIIQDYLNLCSEEYLWKREKLVDVKVWDAWKAGMLYYLQAPAFDEHFEKQKKFSTSYYGLFDELKWVKPIAPSK